MRDDFCEESIGTAQARGRGDEARAGGGLDVETAGGAEEGVDDERDEKDEREAGEDAAESPERGAAIAVFDLRAAPVKGSRDGEGERGEDAERDVPVEAGLRALGEDAADVVQEEAVPASLAKTSKSMFA